MNPWPQITITEVDLPNMAFQDYGLFGPNYNPPPGTQPPTEIAEEGSGPIPPGWPPEGSAVFIPPPTGPQPPYLTGPVGGVLGLGGPTYDNPNITMTTQGRVGLACTPDGTQAVCIWSSPADGNKIYMSYRKIVEGTWMGADVGPEYQWQPPFHLGETSFTGADVCFDPANPGAVLIAWAGTDQNSATSGTINFGFLTFGATGLAYKHTFWNQTANGCPSVTVNNEFTFLAWTGTDSAGTLNLIKLTPLSGPQPTNVDFQQVPLPEQSFVAPRLTWLDSTVTPTVSSDALALSWLGTDGRLNVCTLDPDSGIGTNYVVAVEGFAIASAPSFTALGLWYMAWVDSANNICVASCSGPNGGPLNWGTALGLMANGYNNNNGGTIIDASGVSVAWGWDNNGDGLMLGYGAAVAGAGNDIPLVNSISLNPADWVKPPFAAP